LVCNNTGQIIVEKILFYVVGCLKEAAEKVASFNKISFKKRDFTCKCEISFLLLIVFFKSLKMAST